MKVYPNVDIYTVPKRNHKKTLQKNVWKRLNTTTYWKPKKCRNTV